MPTPTSRRMNRRLFALSWLAVATVPAPARAASLRQRFQEFRRRPWRSRAGLLGLLGLAIGIPLALRNLAGRDGRPRPWDKP